LEDCPSAHGNQCALRYPVQQRDTACTFFSKFGKHPILKSPSIKNTVLADHHNRPNTSVTKNTFKGIFIPKYLPPKEAGK
jgi:hypothetical protein